MSPLQEQLKGRVPPSLWNAARSSWYSIYRATKWPAATFHPWHQSSVKNLNAYKDSHAGERCFIVGNGPSLKQTDLNQLQNEFRYCVEKDDKKHIITLFSEKDYLYDREGKLIKIDTNHPLDNKRFEKSFKYNKQGRKEELN